MKPMHSALALSAAIAVAGLALSANPAAAANSAMAACNKQWNDETAANTTNGVAYQDFLKACLSKSATPAAGGAVAQTDTTAPATTAPATTTQAAKTATAAPVDPAVTKAKKDCADQFKTAKAADPTMSQKKTDFVNACLAKAGIAVPAATTKAATTTTPADAAVTKAKKDCATEYKTAKTADPTLTQSKTDFVNACLAKAGIAVPAAKATATTTPATTTPATTTPATTTPATTTKAATTTPVTTTKAATTPTVAKTTTATTTPAATTPATTTPATTTTATTTPATTTPTKPKSPAQLAEQARIKECGDQWKTLKANNQTNGQTWPQFWHTCDTQLKAAAGVTTTGGAATTTTTTQ